MVKYNNECWIENFKMTKGTLFYYYDLQKIDSCENQGGMDNLQQ
jgi:hypothetical protein